MRVRKLMRRLGGFGVWQDSELWCSKGGDGGTYRLYWGRKGHFANADKLDFCERLDGKGLPKRVVFTLKNDRPLTIEARDEEDAQTIEKAGKRRSRPALAAAGMWWWTRWLA